MKYISDFFNAKTGVSEVIVQHLGIKFKGVAKVHPEDKDIQSSYFGCYLAELRAKVLAYKYERYLLKKKADDAIDLLKACKCYADFDKNSPTAKVLYRQVNVRVKKVNEVTDKINDLLRLIKQEQQSRTVVIKAIQRKKDMMSKKDK